MSSTDAPRRRSPAGPLGHPSQSARQSTSEPPARPSERSVGLTIGALLALVGLLPLWRGGHAVPWLLWVAGALVVLGLAIPSALTLPNRAWTAFGHTAGRVTNPLLLGLVYFLIMTPMSLALRLTGRDPLGLRFRRAAPTYWQKPKLAEQPLQQSMRRQF